MSALKRFPRNMAFRCCFTVNPCYGLLPAILCLLLFGSTGLAAEGQRRIRQFPLEMDALMGALTDAHLPDACCREAYPKVVRYRYQSFDFATDRIGEETRTVRLARQPRRVIPQAIGITEIVWAIMPRDRIIAVHKSCKDPRFSFIAKSLPAKLPTYGTEDAEIVIGFKPDLVLTSFYSNENFLRQLQVARVPAVRLGFFGDLQAIEEQILLIGRLVGEEPSAKRLVDTMEAKLRQIQAFVRTRKPADSRPLTVLFYDNMGYVAGSGTTFDSMCRLLGVTNLAAERGLKYFKQIDYETLLKWNPDIIIVPEESTFDQQLYNQPILATAKAVRQRNIRKMPSVYLLSASQYLVASVNYLAGLLYGQ